MISLLIVTYNRGWLLQNSLVSLCRRTLPDEIIVVDDGGTDHTEKVCRTWGQRMLPIRYFYNNHPGMTNRCHASNVALRLASHDDILVCDAETMFITDVVAQLQEARKNQPEAVLCAEYAWREPYEGGYPDELEKVPGGLVNLYRRDWLLDVGGWDESLPAPTGYDDVDLHSRLAHKGHVQTPVPGVVVHHQWHPLHPMNDPLHPMQSWMVGCRNPSEVRWSEKRFPRDLVANQSVEWGILRDRAASPLMSSTCGGGGCGRWA